MQLEHQREIKGPGPLLGPDGSLADIGWSRQPLLDCNLEKAAFYKLRFLQPLRLKRWDYYAITTPTHFFSFTISDIGYLGMIFAYVVDFQRKTYHEETLAIPLAGGVQLPRGSQSGVSKFANNKAALSFSTEPDHRHLSIRWPGFEGKGLSAEVELALPPEHESMTIVIPIEKKRFYYNRKVNCMPASGWVEYAGQRHELNPNTCLGSLDWGRGVWAYKSFWLWASASGFLPDGRRVGLNLGYGFGDNSAATENAIILDGRIHKLGQVEFNYDPQDYREPWHITSADDRLDITLTPFLERVARTDAKLLFSEVHQMFGKYHGVLVSDEGETIILDGLIGFAEEHQARW